MQTSVQPDQYPAYPSYPENGLWHHMSLALQQSMYRVMSLLIGILPGLFAFIIAVALMTGVGMLLSYLLRRALAAARFDERMAHNQANGIADWSPAHSPTALAGRFVFWGCVVLGLIIGVSAFDASYSGTSSISNSLLPYLTRSVGAILLLLAGNIIARYLARTVLIGAVNHQLQYARFLSMGVKWLVLVLTAAMVLDHLQIGGAVVELAFGILFGGIVLTLSLAIGLGSRDLVTRSLERSVERTDRGASTGAVSGKGRAETLRHF